MRHDCVEFTVFSERVYKAFLDLIKFELDGVGAADINPIQAFILLNIDENSVTMSEVISRGYYVGSNASYNLKRMLASGYIEQNASTYDKRIAYLNLTNKGKTLIEKLNGRIARHNKTAEVDFKKMSNSLSRLENHWRDILNKNPCR